MDWITGIDISILLFIQEHIRADWMDGIWKAITFLGDVGWFWIALGIALLIPKKTRKMGLMALLSLALGALITNVALKPLIARIRPFDLENALTVLVRRPRDYSFPSGHTCASFACAFIYYRMAPKKYGVPAVILAALIGLSRLYVGVHYPTDVLGGLLIGAISSAIIYYAAGKIEQKGT